MEGLQADAVMPKSVTDMLRWLAAGILAVGFLLLGAAHPASAHGAGHHQIASQNAGQLMPAYHHCSETPVPGHRCDSCPGCCAMGQCSTTGVALPGSPSLTAWLTRQSVDYGGYKARDAAGPGAAPATPPPKLDS